MTALWTPETLAAAILWRPLDARRARKVRHLLAQVELSVQAVLDAVAARTDAVTAADVRDTLARVGVAP